MEDPAWVVILDSSVQKRASWLTLDSTIQKLTPSLHAPKGAVLAPVWEKLIADRSAPFQSDTTLPSLFVTRTRSPSNAAWTGEFNPLPVRVSRTAPEEARTTVTELESRLGTQMFVPSKTGKLGLEPTVIVRTFPPQESSFTKLPR